MIYRDLRERVGLESRDGVRVPVKEAASLFFFFLYLYFNHFSPFFHARLKCVALSEQKGGWFTLFVLPGM